MLRYRVLGALDVEREGRPAAIVGRRQRALLSILLLHANRLVTADSLVLHLWGEEPPPSATSALHNAISQLRKSLGEDAIETQPRGYVLHADEGALDVQEFERLYSAGEYEEALALWRGPAYAELRDYAFAQGDLRRLDELQLVAVEERVDARLAAGESGSLVGELEALVAHHPHRERLRGQLMLSLYRSGRQPEALDVYHAARRTLIDELGIEPGRQLQELHRAILRREADVPEVPATVQGGCAEEVVRALLAGRLIPVLGPGVVPSGGDGEVAAKLCELFDCPPEIGGSLARVSEYVALTQGVGALHDELHKLFDRDIEPGAAHRFLATLPPQLRSRGLSQLLILTTSYDETLECAFDEAGEAYDVVAYVAHGPHRGKFVHIPHDGRPRVIDEPNADAAVTTNDVPVILKIHGCVDRRPAREWESFVVSEDDYIDYLATVEPATAVPVSVAAKLRRSHFLFLAYGVVDWNLRVFLRRIWGDDRVAYRSWAVQPCAGTLERDFWRHHDVELIHDDIDDYVANLERFVGDLVGAPR